MSMTRRSLFRRLLGAAVAVKAAPAVVEALPAPQPAGLAFHPKAFALTMEPLDDHMADLWRYYHLTVGDHITVEGMSQKLVITDVVTEDEDE